MMWLSILSVQLDSRISSFGRFRRTQFSAQQNGCTHSGCDKKAETQLAWSSQKKRKPMCLMIHVSQHKMRVLGGRWETRLIMYIEMWTPSTNKHLNTVSLSKKARSRVCWAKIELDDACRMSRGYRMNQKYSNLNLNFPLCLEWVIIFKKTKYDYIIILERTNNSLTIVVVVMSGFVHFDATW